ncbi:hypothetical protein HK102_006043 [Quaeritorhiza haematococci]|nr:hypothetical protein HK102_006043 [Quaeritorhiza haematococci]
MSKMKTSTKMLTLLCLAGSSWALPLEIRGPSSQGDAPEPRHFVLQPSKQALIVDKKGIALPPPSSPSEPEYRILPVEDEKETRLSILSNQRKSALRVSSASRKGQSVLQASKFPRDLENLGLQFQVLRQIRGHYQGRQWNDAVDSADGEKHRLMEELQRRLISLPGITVEEIHNVMGEPDASRLYVDVADSADDVFPSWRLGTDEGAFDPRIQEPLIETEDNDESIAFYEHEESSDGDLRGQENIPTPTEDGGYENDDEAAQDDGGLVGEEDSELKDEWEKPQFDERDATDTEENVRNKGVDSFYEVYLWRDWHDYLWIVSEDGIVVRSGWYHSTS